MLRIRICVALIILLIGCSGRPASQFLQADDKKLAGNKALGPVLKAENQSEPERRMPTSDVSSYEKVTIPAKKNELPKAEQQAPAIEETSMDKILSSPPKVELPKLEQQPNQIGVQPLDNAAAARKKGESAMSPSKADLFKPQINEYRPESQVEAERDIMEEALVLLNESHNYWVNGDLENALEMLDQAYAILLETNGNPDIARQKDDLRLMISKRILSIYNSIHTVAKGIRSEIPVITNADVEKEIRQFQTVERDFFISSYQRSAMYRPIILRELKKAGLPEELSWLPLVESGFKISALSSARALGLWQFIPSTGYKYGLNRDEWVDERMDFEKSTRAAIDYLKELHTMFGDWLTVLAAYNCGEGRVIRTIASQHISYLDRFWDLYQKLPYETARYVPRFLATLLIVREPHKYGIDLGTTKLSALSYEAIDVNKPMRLQDIAQALNTQEEILNILNAELRHKITPDKPYKLRVPAEFAELLPKVIDRIPEVESLRISALTKKGVVIRHTVREGETIASIASKYKIPTSVLTSYNSLSKKKRLVAGQRLNIPIQTGRSISSSSQTQKPDKIIRYTVQKGDTLASLARKYDITVSELKKSNSLGNDVLRSGQILRIEKVDEEDNRQQKKGSSDKSVAKLKTGKTPGTEGSSDKKMVKKYTVKKGDSLNKIARENNMSIEKLLDLNKLDHKKSINPGQIILVQ